MSTYRYSGAIRIRLTYLPVDFTKGRTVGEYRCALRTETERITVYVREPAALIHAVDSPHAYDSAAHAAITFADHERPGWAEHAETEADGRGYVIRRRRDGHGKT